MVKEETERDLNSFYSLVRNPVKFRLYLLKNLPAAFFSGLKVKSITAESAEVIIPFKWFTQNPFRSTYFACLSMAAELSTGILAMASLYKRKPSVSMLIVGIEGAFFKKAVGVTTFLCSDGDLISEAIKNAINTNEPQQVKAHSVGKNEDGEIVAEFWCTWSFKKKNSHQ